MIIADTCDLLLVAKLSFASISRSAKRAADWLAKFCRNFGLCLSIVVPCHGIWSLFAVSLLGFHFAGFYMAPKKNNRKIDGNIPTKIYRKLIFNPKGPNWN